MGQNEKLFSSRKWRKKDLLRAIEKPPLKPSGDTYLYIYIIVGAQDLHKFYIWKDILKKLDFIAPYSILHFLPFLFHSASTLSELI